MPTRIGRTNATPLGRNPITNAPTAKATPTCEPTNAAAGTWECPRAEAVRREHEGSGERRRLAADRQRPDSRSRDERQPDRRTRWEQMQRGRRRATPGASPPVHEPSPAASAPRTRPTTAGVRSAAGANRKATPAPRSANRTSTP